MRFISNELPGYGQPLSDHQIAMLGHTAPSQVRPYLALWGQADQTPLVLLDDFAQDLDLATVALKDEGQRLGQGSFKALGGAYAVMVLFKEKLEAHLGEEVSIPQLLSPTARDFAQTVTVCCATDGNHGKSVARGARLLGCRSVIFIHQGVSQSRVEAIGADEIVRVEGSYDLSVDEARRVAAEKDWLLVADTAWPGYERIPELVGQGYSILAEEAKVQMSESGRDAPTHVFLQAGVGGFAASVAAYLSDQRDNTKPIVVIVEPERAACVFESAKTGNLVSVEPVEPTIMAMLECFTPSLTAWQVLEKTASAFMTVEEEDARDAMRRLALRDQPVVAGESGAAGLAGLLLAARDPELRQALRLDHDSRVLLINTETATDPQSYAQIVGRTPDEVCQQFMEVAGE